MGIFSEIDLDNKTINTGDNTNISASEAAARRDEAKQEAEAVKARQMLEEMMDGNEGCESDEEANQSPAPKIRSSEPTEEEKRKAHEESEAKRKAEWEEKKKAREEKEIMEWEAAVNMNDGKLIEASVKRLGDDAERITRRNMKQCVTEYVQMRCCEDMNFARQVMHPRKSMIQCFRYINRQALEFVKQEMKDNDIKPSNEGYGCDIPDDMCYKWAVDYFFDMEAPEDKKEGEEEFVPKPYTSSTARKASKAKTEKKKKEEPAAKAVPPEPANAQLSLFGTEVA